MSSKHYEARLGFADHLALIVCFLQEVDAETKVSIYGMSTLHCEQHTETWTLMNSKGQIFLWHFCKILKKRTYSFPLVSSDTKKSCKNDFSVLPGNSHPLLSVALATRTSPACTDHTDKIKCQVTNPYQ